MRDRCVGRENFPAGFCLILRRSADYLLKMQLSDGILLRRFCENCDQAAFRTLVDRHLPLVYSTALRILRSADLAQDVSQQTFVRLVRKAGGIRRESGLVPWLHLTARALAIDSLRSERRRQAREMKSVSLMTAPTSPSPDWEALAP
ncbi:MAG: polymerase, sigma-24 subunit, subfamily, partial [Akkermansiaceae bacterium]|nr:polymerase, sigma-24 subunit, subfamily [Akkermansiaceae bacterium]